MELTMKQLKKLAELGAHIHVHVGEVSPVPDPEDPPEDPPVYFQKPDGSKQAPVYDAFVKGTGRIEPSDSEIVGYVRHGDQVLLMDLPENMANTYIPDDWWYVYVVGREYLGWVRKKEGRDVVEK